MYWDWASFQEEIEFDRGNQSVLHKFPASVGREVACHVVKYIAQSLSIASGTDEPSNLQDEKDVNWTMEVLCFGLGLPLTEHEAINNCVKVYVEWLSALVSPKPCVPRPIIEDPNPFAQVMLHHLLNLFKPRPDSSTDLVNKQAVLCHRVLRAIESVAKESAMLTRETWEVLLKFLLAANDSLLSPPTEKDIIGLSNDDIGDHLCDRVLSVLFIIWVTACHKSFPSPSLWKTFRNMCLYWRHHEALVTMWHRVNHALTASMLKIMYGPDFPEMTISEEEAQLLPADMSNESIAQCWFRFLHILQNPVDLSRPSVVSNTPKFLQYALTSEAVIDPSYHPCLGKLPAVFLRAMRGISVMVNAFLGLPQELKMETSQSDMQAGLLGSKLVTTPSTPPGQRRAAKTISVLTGTLATKVSSKTHASKNIVQPPVNSTNVEKLILETRLPYAPKRPKCNSILHLFDAWLFDASLAGVKLHPSHAAPTKERRTSSFIESKHSSLSMDLNTDPSQTRDVAYQAGRAEACGALCRIFCAHKTGEVILPEYYARFYLIMYYGLQTDEATISGEVLSNILFNSCSLLRVDLSGVQLLLPYILKAIELVLSKTAPDFKLCEQIPYSELRKACIHLLISMLCLPLHFKDLEIKDILKKDDGQPPVTFISLRSRITELIRVALTNEADSQNTQMLLGGLLLVVEDLASSEQADNLPLQPNHDISDSDIHSDAKSSPLVGSGESSSYHESNRFQETSFSKSPTPTNIDTAYGLFGLATSLVCNRLMATWKTDLNVALAAMELLSGLAKVKINPANLLMCKRTVKWMCDLIVYQCSRPAPSHSRDLHSMLCAAFKCLQLWLVEHSSLLYDRECLHQVLEVVELGISGSKSQTKTQEMQTVKVKIDKDSKSVSMKNRASDPPKYKGSKELMPASMRVKDAAEALLTCIIDQVGAFPPPCGPESLFSLLDERSLLKFAKGNALPEQGSLFKYFVIDNSVIVGLMEQPLGNIEDPLPTVTALIRGAFGRHAWTMQLRHSPRVSKISSRAHLSDPGRPLPDDSIGQAPSVKHRYFPESVEKIPQTKAEKSIPPLESVLTEKQACDVEIMKGLIDQVATFEKEVSQRAKIERDKAPFPNPATECKPPKICNEYQTARLFLSHYGLLSLEALKEPSNSSVPPDLIMLDTTNSGLFTDLECLDFIPSRDNDTVHIFYVKPGQTSAAEILSNVSCYNNVQPQFVEFLHSLGWPVDVRKHAGWTGHVATSWKIIEPDDMDEDEYQTGTGGSLYDGRQQVLYWADVLSELALVVPSTETFRIRSSSTSETGPENKSPPIFRGLGSYISTDSQLLSKPTSLLLEAEKSRLIEKDSPGSPPEVPASTAPPAQGGVKFRRLGRQPASMTGPDTKVLVVWLESFEDHDNFPISELLIVTSTGQEQGATSSTTTVQRPQEKDIYVIFIHALQNGLFRIHMMEYEKTQTKMSIAIPLVDGMVVSRRTLGSMVRQTAINICRRRRLESEYYQPPHVRRKLKIQEMVSKYRCSVSPAEFYTALFQDSPK
ncbi:ral GTPase-activating protein subunit beta-like isoform X3 [Biomphalaria glabrata]|uniref:Ral GTPase-activating protein subunit beta-like isoform X3 n=1 Tax=Biomphalaria glabrata TaxID=6526 RepID=A0A9W2ZVR2_BIOGL|nr:ral GTPase-activating protein subunit beta-like isoform X3 [Biomphalaria glabrata]